MSRKGAVAGVDATPLAAKQRRCCKALFMICADTIPKAIHGKIRSVFIISNSRLLACLETMILGRNH